MKIAHVVDSMEVGGAETLVAQMCELQRAQGHHPEVYAVAALGSLGEQMRAKGFLVEPDVGRHLADASLRFFRLFRSAQPDVVHLHNPTPTIYAAPAARLAGVASIVSTRHSLVAPPRNLTMERKYRVAAKFCDWIVGICDATTKNIREAGSAPDRKIVRVYNGATPVIRSGAETRLPKTGFTLVFIGRLEPVKNLGYLLESFRMAVDRISDLQLWIVGDGSERTRLAEISARLRLDANVTFWGQRLDVAPFLRSADAFIMSSVSEGLPMSLLQALSVGLPAIVTDVGGMGEVVRLAESGFAVPLGHTEAMAAAIVHIASDPDARQGLADNASRAFETHFTLPAVVSEYEALYRNTPRAKKIRRP